MFSATSEIFREFVESMQSLQAPEELTDEHDAFIQAIEALTVLWDGFTVMASSFDSLEDVGVLLEAVDGSLFPLMTDVERACTRLQDAAAANGASADFSCV
jgi:hypothetical protein